MLCSRLDQVFLMSSSWAGRLVATIHPTHIPHVSREIESELAVIERSHWQCSQWKTAILESYPAFDARPLMAVIHSFFLQ